MKPLWRRITIEKLGKVKIDNEVLGMIAAIATAKVPGVHRISRGFVGGVSEFFGKKAPEKGIRVSISEDEVSFELGVILDYGVDIPEVAWQIQKSVKNTVEKMSNLKVKEVNIEVRGIHLERGET